ncbi:adenine deaminase [archaeon]|nr:MAG: adenine deaminase [archaeon]
MPHTFHELREKFINVFPRLIDVSLGRLKADILIKDCTLVNVFTGELQEHVDIAVKDGFIAFVGGGGDVVGSGTKVVDGKNLYAAPGFMDGHVHVESSMVTFSEFSKIALVHGTTSIFADPHEIANVLGVDGLKMVLDEIRRIPLRVFICVPSCVPASIPEFETAGAELSAEDVKEILSWPESIALGELMNYPGGLSKDEKMLAEIRAALKLGKVIEGHSDGIMGSELNAYISTGVSSCHEATRVEEVVERLRLGMYSMIREGSVSKNLKEGIRAVTEFKLNARRVILVTDDRHPEDLLREGYMDHLVHRAIEEGVDPITAIQMVTINTAEHFKIDDLLGAIGPGRVADIVLLSDLNRVKVDTVLINGAVVVRDGVLKIEVRRVEYPKRAKETVKLHKTLTPEDFRIKARIPSGRVRAHVIGVLDGFSRTRHLIEEVDVVDGEVAADPRRDIALVAVIERHRASGNIGRGLLKGFGLREGAIASTVAHDSHNLIVLGMNPTDMAVAANEIARINGGIVAVVGGKVLGRVELPIAGLISDEPLEVVAERVRHLNATLREMGCKLTAPFMVLSSLSLSVLPELRITDRGLVDSVKFKLIDLFVD